jgi:hypothetical protein
MDEPGLKASWRRNTWNTNRAAAVIEAPGADVAIGPHRRRMKRKLLRQAWSIPFLYGLGLRVVVAGDGLREAMDRREDPGKSVD